MTSGKSRERNARQLEPQIGRVALAILGVVQDGVDVMEDVPFGDGRVAVVRAELFERPVGDRTNRKAPSVVLNRKWTAARIRGQWPHSDSIVRWNLPLQFHPC